MPAAAAADASAAREALSADQAESAAELCEANGISPDVATASCAQLWAVLGQLPAAAARRRVEACMTDVCGLADPQAAVGMHRLVHADVQEQGRHEEYLERVDMDRASLDWMRQHWVDL